MILAETDVPDSMDWRAVGGISFVTADVNQHIPGCKDLTCCMLARFATHRCGAHHAPQFSFHADCGSCWIHGTIAALNDRIKIARRAAFPDVMLSRQALMNCVQVNSSEAPPGCNGGDAWMIHRHLKSNRVGDETCQPYEAKNGVCDPFGTCRNCLPHGMEGNPVGKDCWAMPSFITYGVSEFGQVSGERAMQKEILARGMCIASDDPPRPRTRPLSHASLTTVAMLAGPIVCSLAADERFMFEYAAVVAAHDGVYVDRRPKTADDVDHDVEVAGWGVTESGTKYWIVRNSWGSYWGQHGWFQILRGENMLFIESDCDWAVPTSDNLDGVLGGELMGDYVHGVGRVATTPASLTKSAMLFAGLALHEELKASGPSASSATGSMRGASASSTSLTPNALLLLLTVSALCVGAFGGFAFGGGRAFGGSATCTKPAGAAEEWPAAVGDHGEKAYVAWEDEGAASQAHWR